MDVIDRLQVSMKRLKELGIEIRFEDLNGVPGGLCSLDGRRILVVDITQPSGEQLELFEATLANLSKHKRSVA